MDTLLLTQMFPRLPALATFVADTHFVSGMTCCVWDTKNVSDFVQEHFVSVTNVSQFAQPKKHHGQQYVLVYQGLCKWHSRRILNFGSPFVIKFHSVFHSLTFLMSPWFILLSPLTSLSKALRGDFVLIEDD